MQDRENVEEMENTKEIAKESLMLDCKTKVLNCNARESLLNAEEIGINALTKAISKCKNEANCEAEMREDSAKDTVTEDSRAGDIIAKNNNARTKVKDAADNDVISVDSALEKNRRI